MTEDQFNTYRELGELKAKVKGVPIPPEIYNSARQIKYNIDNHHRYRVPPNTDALGNEFAQGHTNKFYTTPTKDDLRNGYNAAQSIQNHEFNHFVFTNTKGDGDKLKQSFSPAEEGKAYAGLSAKGKRRTKAYFDAQNGVEYRARVGQIMDFLEFKADPKGGIINRFGEKELTKGALRYAKKNYIKEVGIDNNMQDFFDRMIDEDNVVK